jgi:hypothetical protein
MDRSSYDRFHGDGTEDWDDDWDELPQETQYQLADQCPDCDGSGIIIIGFDDNPDVYENIEVECPRCKGTRLYFSALQ